MSKELASTLGIYFIIFYKLNNQYVRCWFNGSEESHLYSHTDFINLSQKEKLNYKLRLKISDCLTESSLFLWDVEKDIVKPLTPQALESNIGEVLKNKTQEAIKEISDKNKNNKKGLFNIPLFKWK